MTDQLVGEPPKARKLFPLFYKMGSSNDPIHASPTVQPRVQRKAQSKPNSLASGDDIRGPQKAKKSSKKQPLRKAGSDGKLTATFHRQSVRSPVPIPLSPTSLNRPLTSGDITEDDVEQLSAATSEDIVLTISSPAPSSLPDSDAGGGGSSCALLSPISISSVDDNVISVVAPLPKRAPKARQATPIVIEDDGGKTVIPSRSTKPLARTETMSSVGSRDQPIEIPDSPAKLKPSHPFFAPRPAVPTSPTRTPRVPPEWPLRDAQHIRGDQTYIRVGSPTVCLARPANITSVLGAAPVAWLNSASAFNEPPRPVRTHSDMDLSLLESNPPTIAASHSSHPAFHAHYDPSPSGTWNERYRPTAAQHVLGNEHHACYLRSWLKALRLQIDSTQEDPPTKAGIHQIRTKRSAVIRAVNPKRKRRRASNDSDVDEWIVSEEEEEFGSDGAMGRSDDDFHPTLQDTSTDTPNPDGDLAFTKLSNVILLSGPPGVGKSAAAHACAMELDWSVFEIYPGIGKRSGTSILSLVGDAARNHLLHRARTRDDHVLPNRGTTAERARPGTFSSERPNHAVEARTVRQSLFLFDEVDNLFREDANFWPTLVQLIADSRRPVILTCNDTSLIPMEDLPFQAILEFKPCEPELATSYLQHLARLNGLHLDRGVAHSIYACDGISSARRDRSRGDLRQSINILQFWASLAAASTGSSRESVAADAIATDWSHAPGTAVNTPLQRYESIHADAKDLHDLWRFTDIASQFDSQRSCLIASIEQMGQPQEEDDVMGHVQLPASDAMNHLVGSGFLDRFDSIKAAALWASRREYESTGAGIRARGSASPSSVRMDLKTLSANRRWHQMQQTAFLEDIVSSSALTISRREMVLDYVPRVMEMVRCDDVFEANQYGGAIWAEGRGRRTRGQRKQQYERYVTLGPSAMAAVRTLGWHVD